MRILTRHEASYISSRGIEESLFSKNAYVPKEIKVSGNTYAFYLDREERNVQVLSIFGSDTTGLLSTENKIPF